MDKLSLLKKYFSFSIGIWINAIISFFTTPVVTYLINPSEFGKATLFSTAYSMFLLVVLSGLPNSFMRFFPKQDEEQLGSFLWSCLLFPLIFTLIISLLLFVFSGYINLFLVGESHSIATILLIGSLITGVFQTFNSTVIRVKGKGFLYSLIQVLQSLSQVVFVILYAKFVDQSFYCLLYAQLFSSIFALAIGIIFEHNYWFPIRINKRKALEALKYGYPFVFSGLLWWLLQWTDRFVLRLYTDFNEIGLYSVTFKIVSAMNLLTSGFSTLWYPFAYEHYEKNPDGGAFFSKALDYVAFLTFSIGFLVLTFKDVIFLLLAKTYRPSASISPFLLLSPIMTMISIVIARGIDFSKKTYWFIVSDGCAAVFNLIGNLLLIPSYGAKGAALSTGLSFVIVFAIESTVSKRLYPAQYNLVKIYIVTALFCISAMFHTLSTFHLFPSIFSSAMLIVTLYLYKSEFTDVLRELVTLSQELFKRGKA